MTNEEKEVMEGGADMKIEIQIELLTRANETLMMLEDIKENIIMEDNKDKITKVTDCYPSSLEFVLTEAIKVISEYIGIYRVI